MCIEKRERMDVKKMCFCSCVVYENKMFFFTEGSSLLAEMNLQNYNVKILSYMSKDANHEDTDMLVSNNRGIYRLLKNGKEVIEYSLEGKEQYRYVLNEGTMEWGNFSFMTLFDHYLYLFPRYVNKTIIIDIKKREIVSNNNFFEENGKLDYETLLYRKGCRISDDLVMLFSRRNEDVLIYNLKSQKYERVVLSHGIEGIISICEAEDLLYVFDTHHKLYKWDFQNGVVNFLSEIENVKGDNYFGNIVNTDRNVILLPALGDDIYIFDKKERSFHIYQEYPEDFGYFGYKNWAKYVNECCTKEYIYFPMRKSQYILRIERETGKLGWIKPFPPLVEDKLCDYMDKNIRNFREGRETLTDLSLKEYICLIQKGL